MFSNKTNQSRSLEDIGVIEEALQGETGRDALIFCLQGLLTIHNMSFSIAAIRDLQEDISPTFGLDATLSVLRHLDFEASVGKLPTRRLTKDHLPAIGFLKSGIPVVIEGIEEDGTFKIINFHKHLDLPKTYSVSSKEFSDQYLSLFLLAKRQVSLSPKPRKGDWFWKTLFQNKWLYVQVIIAAALSNFLGLSTSLFVMVVYDRVVPNEAVESLIALTIGVLIALVFDFIIKTLRSQFIDKAGRAADARMSRLVFDRLLALRLDKERQKSGAMASIIREFDTLREFFTSATLVAIVDLPFIFLFIWVIHLISGPLALVPLIAVPIVILVGLLVQPLLARISEGSMASNMSKQGILVETLNGLETVQATGSGRLMRMKFEAAADAQSALGLKNRMISQFAINSAASVQQVAQIATIFYGVFLIQDGQATMGSLIAAVILGGRALGPLSQLASAMTRANSARQAYRSLSNIMSDNSTDQATPRRRLSRPHLTGAVDLVNVSFTFPGQKSPSIRNMNLRIPAGQKVAIVGKVGSGKTTLAKLVTGMIEPSEGAVRIDGVDIRQIDPSDLRRNVGIMLQETWLFSGSIKENIQMGYYEYDDEYLLQIAKSSGVDDFVASKPQGYDFELKERGEGLSGGQRQSINLARALLHNPNLLVLDEPTSSMDTGTEKAVIERLKERGPLCTIVMVTHRNSLLEVADRVLVIDQGSIVADTTPEQLRAKAKGLQ